MHASLKFVRNNAILLFLAAMVPAIHLLSLNNEWVEAYYSAAIYPYIGGFLRTAFGWIPFSIGDLLYLLLIAIAAWIAIQGIRSIKKDGWTAPIQWRYLKAILILITSTYLVFNLLWGLNYNRLGIAHQLDLVRNDMDTSQLRLLTARLLDRTNGFSSHAGLLRDIPPERIFKGAVDCYTRAEAAFPFLRYQHPSVKRSLFGVIGNYLGYSGYYNPFTAEAHINDAVPNVLHPFVACHEIAHQIGYAREDEANFVGFLVARMSADTAFLYSAYFDMFLYANAALYRTDSAAANMNMKSLHPEVQRDIFKLREFRLRYQSPIEKIIDAAYDRYLRMNQQPEGTLTYSRVVRWLMAYLQKNGDI
jgi:hypothetical protein